MFNVFDPAAVLDRAQVANIKFQTAFDACNLQLMVDSLDQRMSNLDFTLGIISQVMAKTAGGLQTQDFALQVNTSDNSFWVTFNQVYPYFIASDWTNVGRYMMLLATGLLNFQSPKVSSGLETF